MIDIQKLPKPELIEEIDYSVILEMYTSQLKADMPKWTGSDADPVKKVFRAAAFREMFLRQRVNEVARKLLLAFAKGTNLDNLAAWFGEERMKGSNATCEVKITAVLSVTDQVVPTGYVLQNDSGTVQGKLTEELVFAPGETEKTISVEITSPAGSAGNGIDGVFSSALNSLPFIEKIEQVEKGTGGADLESDERFLVRILLANSKQTTAGSENSYKAWAMKADSRIKDVEITTPVPAFAYIYLLSSEGDGTADAQMIQRVQDTLSPEEVRPTGDVVVVNSGSVVTYDIEAKVYLFPSAPLSVVDDVQKKAEKAAAELHKLGYDITKSALTGRMWVEGVQSIEFISPAQDIIREKNEAAFATSISITLGGINE